MFAQGDEVSLKKTDLTKTVAEAKNAIYEAIVREGYFPTNPQTVRTFYTIIAVLALVTLNVPLGVSAYFFGRAIALSLRNFLTSQEKKLAFGAKHQLLFEKFLPYAVVFGVEKLWAKRFAHLAMQPPRWYEGYSSSRFTTVSFVGSLDSSLQSIARVVTPSSSSSGFSSGFSGGSSGGGGGGGSW